MRILTLTNTAGKNSGGVGDVVQNLVFYQNQLDCMSDLWFLDKLERANEVSLISGINNNNLIPLKTLGRSGFGFSPALFLKRKKAVQNYDLIHQHGLFLPNSIFTKSLKKIKKIISPHGFIEPEKLLLSKRKKNIALFLFERENLKTCDCLVACSIQEAIGLRSFGLKQPIGMLPNGISSQFINKDKVCNNFRSIHNISNDKKILLFLSRIERIKGLELLIESMITIREHFEKSDWLLVIAGINENNYQQILEEKVYLNNLSSVVKFVGPQFGDQKINAIDASDCFILPSINENFGIVVIEALARGVPVIATKRTPWEDLESYKCGWWVDRTKESIINVLLALTIKKPEELKLMGNNGKELVLEKYMWPSIAKQSVALYNWVLNNFDEKNMSGFTLFED